MHLSLLQGVILVDKGLPSGCYDDVSYLIIGHCMRTIYSLTEHRNVSRAYRGVGRHAKRALTGTHLGDIDALLHLRTG